MGDQQNDDQLQIQRFMAKYARAVDTRDWNLYRTLFTDDADLDYTSAPFGIKGSVDPR